jgi:hypothetical protein
MQEEEFFSFVFIPMFLLYFSVWEILLSLQGEIISTLVEWASLKIWLDATNHHQLHRSQQWLHLIYDLMGFFQSPLFKKPPVNHHSYASLAQVDPASSAQVSTGGGKGTSPQSK